MVPIIEVSDETLRTLNLEVYTRRNDLENSRKSKNTISSPRPRFTIYF